MRIQLAVVDTDTTYLTRLQERVTDAYAGRVELLAFTALDKALASLAETRTNVLVVHESIEVDAEALPPRVELAHLVDAPDVESVRGIRAVSKFAPVDAFYRAVVELYDAASSTMQMRSGRPGTTSQLVVLTSPPDWQTDPDARHASQREDVMIVERCGPYLDHNLTRARRRAGIILHQAEVLNGSVSLNHHCAHGRYPFSRWSTSRQGPRWSR